MMMEIGRIDELMARRNCSKEVKTRFFFENYNELSQGQDESILAKELAKAILDDLDNEVTTLEEILQIIASFAKKEYFNIEVLFGAFQQLLIDDPDLAIQEAFEFFKIIHENGVSSERIQSYLDSNISENPPRGLDLVYGLYTDYNLNWEDWDKEHEYELQYTGFEKWKSLGVCIDSYLPVFVLNCSNDVNGTADTAWDLTDLLNLMIKLPERLVGKALKQIIEKYRFFPNEIDDMIEAIDPLINGIGYTADQLSERFLKDVGYDSNDWYDYGCAIELLEKGSTVLNKDTVADRWSKLVRDNLNNTDWADDEMGDLVDEYNQRLIALGVSKDKIQSYTGR